MKYVLANKQKALDIGINTIGHFKKGDMIILNEKEVMENHNLDGDIEERVKTIGAKLYTNSYTKRIIKTEQYVI